MINISVRQKRLLKIWAVNFTIALVSGIAAFAAVVGICVGLIILGKIYGPGAILGSISGFFILVACAGATYSFSKEKLEKIEREEQRTLDALKTDFSNSSSSQSYKDLMNQISNLSAKISRKPFK